MKKLIFTLLILLAFSPETDAQMHRGAIQIKLRDNKMLTVVLDGRHFRKYGTSITIADLPEGMHELKAYYFYPANDAAYRNLRDNKSHGVLAYKGRIHVDGGMMYYCTVDATYKSVSIRESRTVSIDESERSYPISTETIFSDEKERNSYEDKDNWDDRKKTDKNQVISYYKNENRLTETQFQTLKNAVNERMGSEDKVELIKDFVAEKSLMTDQVISMMGWLSFESSKLEIAKSCYTKILDPENYLEVSNLLTFQNSKRELDEVIFRKNKKNKFSEEITDEDLYDIKPKRNTNIYKTERNKQVEQIADGPISQNQIAILEKSVSERMNDSDKQKLMQQYLENSKITTAQVATMLDWLTFEGTKLEFSKWAYKHIMDKENFTKLKAKFTFSSSKKSIDEMALMGSK